MSKTFLKIKIMSLAAEAKIIRQEANKWPHQRDIPNEEREDPKQVDRYMTRYLLNQHRRFDVRREARSAQLAYGFLRGRAYCTIEEKCWELPDANRIAEIAAKFGVVRDKKLVFYQVRDWLTAKVVAKAA